MGNSDTMQINIIVVGIGKQAIDDHIPAIVSSPHFNLVGLVDSDTSRKKDLEAAYEIPFFESVDDAIDLLDHIDAALVCVPHFAYHPLIKKLAENKIHIIREKPFAISSEEAKKYVEYCNENGVGIYVTMQRRFNPIFTSFPQLLRRIGTLYAIEGLYTFNIARLDEGWRSSKEQSGGGALIDMGYHMIDLIVWYFGLPDYVTCSTTSKNRENQHYDVEDTASINFSYNRPDSEQIVGSLMISRVFPEKRECIKAYGSKGSVIVERGRIARYDTDGNEIESLERNGQWPSALVDQLEHFAHEIKNSYLGNNGYKLKQHLSHVALIESCYESAKNHITMNPKQIHQTLIEELTEEKQYAASS